MRLRRRGRTGSRMSCCRERTSQWECNVGVLPVSPEHTHTRDRAQSNTQSGSQSPRSHTDVRRTAARPGAGGGRRGGDRR